MMNLDAYQDLLAPINQFLQCSTPDDSIVVWSPVMDKLAGQNTRVEHACEAAMLMSDNTAANLVLNETRKG